MSFVSNFPAFVLMVIVLASTPLVAAGELSVCNPAFKVNVANPTADKPQSKLWFAHGTWWAWLPTRDGSCVWKRTEDGWQRQTSLDRQLRGLPGRADVCAEGDMVRAVLVEGRSLAVATLNFVEEAGTYALVGRPVLFGLPPDPANRKAEVETATIARDENNRWWIAYPWQRQMWVRSALDVERAAWSEPMSLADPATDDDICAIVALPGGIGVIWSDQVADTVYFRFHRQEAAPGAWQPVEIAAQGNRTADDHINTAVGGDGTLYVASKNSVDEVDRPQLVLYVRSPQGKWSSFPYAPREQSSIPSRPIALVGGTDKDELFLLHSNYMMTDSKLHKSLIAQLSGAPIGVSFATRPKPILTADQSINNATGCKTRLPTGAPWIVLASDNHGHVYEARLD